MLAVSRLVPGCDQRLVLGVERVGGKFKCQVVELVAGRPGFDFISNFPRRNPIDRVLYT
jgi:hypothetical protein